MRTIKLKPFYIEPLIDQIKKLNGEKPDTFEVIGAAQGKTRALLYLMSDGRVLEAENTLTLAHSYTYISDEHVYIEYNYDSCSYTAFVVVENAKNRTVKARYDLGVEPKEALEQIRAIFGHLNFSIQNDIFMNPIGYIEGYNFNE